MRKRDAYNILTTLPTSNRHTHIYTYAHIASQFGTLYVDVCLCHILHQSVAEEGQLMTRFFLNEGRKTFLHFNEN